MTRRPRLTRERIEGLEVLAAIGLRKVEIGALSNEVAVRVRSAARYIRDIEKWNKDRQK